MQERAVADVFLLRGVREIPNCKSQSNATEDPVQLKEPEGS